jgi:UDP-2,3-diacylglucosamine pyrophosphatase LpxH
MFVLVGDVHLIDRATPAARRLARLVDRLAARAARARGSTSLVLMGDTVDLVEVADGSRDPLGGRLAPGDGVACAKLNRIAAAHPQLFSALGHLALAGGSVELIVGNHEQQLARPAVQEHLRDLLLPPGAPDSARRRIGFHPFALYLPGVLYAEHGHRYHAINAAPPALRAHLEDSDERIMHPLGSLLTALRLAAPSLVARARAREAARLAPSLARALARALGARQRPPARTIRGDRRLLAHVAASTGLPEAAVVAVDRLSPPELGLARMLGGPGSGDSNMLRAARRVHAALGAAGAATPFYCFGHTHSAERRPLDGSAAAEYLNAGAYGAGGDAGPRHGTIVVRHRPDRAPLARLCDAGDGSGAQGL